MPRRYTRAAGASNPTAATLDHCAWNIWNPSADLSVLLHELTLSHTATAASATNIGIVRSSTEGTPAGTETPVITDDFDYDLAPTSGVRYPFAAFSVQPTLEPPYLFRSYSPQGTGLVGFSRTWVFEPEPITIPPGTGLAIVTTAAVALPALWMLLVIEEGAS